VISAKVRAAAESLLGTSLGGPARVVSVDRLDRDGHAAVFRLHVAAPGIETIVLKQAHRSDDAPFDPEDQASDGRAGRLWNEWAGLEFLTRLNRRLVTPRFLGGDRHLGFVLLEDLGRGASLAEVLLGSNYHAAVRGLKGYASALATIHTETFSRADEYYGLRRAHGPIDRRAPRIVGFAWDRLLDGLPSLHRGLIVPAGSGDTARLIDARIGDAGPFLAYSPNDCCPDNNRVYADGSVRLFDLEFGDCRHALLDVGYFHSTMPTCWCVRRLPDGLADQLVDHYRRELVASRPARLDEIEDRFDRDLAACRAQWAIRAAAGHLVRLQKTQDDPPRYWSERDFWFCSQRQLLGFRLEQLQRAAESSLELAPLAEFALAARAVLINSGGDIEDVEVYPAFRPVTGDGPDQYPAGVEQTASTVMLPSADPDRERF
jgi:hypothetical protein